MKITAKHLLSALLISSPLFAMAQETVMLAEDFSDPNATVAQQLLNHPKIHHAPGGGVGGTDGIRVEYVGGEMGSERVVVGVPLNGKSDYAKLEFDVFFEEDWQWARGGKMHGVGPRNRITGGRERRPDGWSSRIMFSPLGNVHNYLYDQDPEAKWGKGKTTKAPVFEKGKWHHVTFETQLNTPGQADGWAKTSVDGLEVLLDEKVEFRGVGGEDTLIQYFLFSTFHGGNDSTWAPKDKIGDYTTVHARYDNFRVTSDAKTAPNE